MKYFDIYITLIFITKIIFIILAVYKLYVRTKTPDNKQLLEKINYWKSRAEFIFITLMSALLMYLFYPRAKHLNMIDSETKLLLYLFGFVLLLTENWSIFIQESQWFKEFKKILA